MFCWGEIQPNENYTQCGKKAYKMSVFNQTWKKFFIREEKGGECITDVSFFRSHTNFKSSDVRNDRLISKVV